MNDGIIACDAEGIERKGNWDILEFPCTTGRKVLMTCDVGASLRMDFTGAFLSLLLPPTWQNPGPHYGIMKEAHRGGDVIPVETAIDVKVDDLDPLRIPILTSPLEIVVFRGAESDRHTVTITPVLRNGGIVAVEAFRVLARPVGSLRFRVFGEESYSFNDMRLEARRDGELVQSRIARNARSGECVITGLEEGAYSIRMFAHGWQPLVMDGMEMTDGADVEVGDRYIRRSPRARSCEIGVICPGRGRAVTALPGQEFEILCRTQKGDTFRSAELTSEHMCIPLTFEAESDDGPRYDAYFSVRVRLPDELPEDLYDLNVQFDNWADPAVTPQSVSVRRDYPDEFYLVTFGHTNTWGQDNAEYIERMVEVINVINPLMVLISNEVNWAYLSGVLGSLRVPYCITTGNHGYPDFERFFGPCISAVDTGAIRVVNFGYTWDGPWQAVRELFEQRPAATVRIINAFESDAPVAELLDSCNVNLLHEAHGMGSKIEQFGRTPTWRAGKSNAESFRLVRFRGGNVISATYRGGEVDPIPFSRGQPSPLRVDYLSGPDDGCTTACAAIENDWDERFENARLCFRMARGEYTAIGGRIVQQFNANRHPGTVVDVAVDIPARGSLQVELSPKRPTRE